MISQEQVYVLLEDKMLGYEEVAAIPIEPCAEPMVAIPQSKSLLTRQIEPAMLGSTGEEIYVRETIAEMIGRASMELSVLGSSLQLEVVYGYRHPSIQSANFTELKQEITDKKPGLTERELLEATNRFIAAHENAGHPTGGAVDLQILKDGEAIDMGTGSRVFVPDTYVFSPFISKEAWKNRQTLRSFMLGCGFAPYDGEW